MIFVEIKNRCFKSVGFELKFDLKFIVISKVNLRKVLVMPLVGYHHRLTGRPLLDIVLLHRPPVALVQKCILNDQWMKVSLECIGSLCAIISEIRLLIFKKV